MTRFACSLVLVGILPMTSEPVRAECYRPSAEATVQLLRSAVFADATPLSQDDAARLVQRSDAEAHRHGFAYAPDLLGYALVSRLLGNGFDRNASYPWAAEILARAIPAHSKVDALFTAAGRPELEHILSCGLIRHVHFGEAFDFAMGEVAIAPDGLVLTSRSAGMSDDNVNVASIDLTFTRRDRAETILASASEQRRGLDYLVTVSPPRAVLKLRLEPHRFADRSGTFDTRTWLEVGDVVRFPDGYTLSVKRIKPTPATSVVLENEHAGKEGSELEALLLEPVLSEGHVVEAREIRAASARPAAVLLEVVQPATHVLAGKLSAPVVLRRDESARFPGGLTVTYVGRGQQILTTGECVSFVEVRATMLDGETSTLMIAGDAAGPGWKGFTFETSGTPPGAIDSARIVVRRAVGRP